MPKEIQLSNGGITLVDDGDYEQLVQYKWIRSHYGYAICRNKVATNKFTTIYMHRLIMDCPDKKIVDHKDGDKMNNQRNNLRICTKSGNNKNSSKSKSNKSQYKCVSWDKERNKWRAHITLNYKYILIGRFTSEEDAARAYNKKAIELFGEFAKPNDIKVVNV